MNVSFPFGLPTIPTRSLLPGVLLAGSFAVWGCGGSENTGQFEMTGVRGDDTRASCLKSTFPLDPSFYAARDRIDSVGIFLQSLARVEQEADLVYLEVFTPDEIRDDPDTAVAVEYPSTASTPVRAEVDVRETCPDLNVSLAVRGRVQFDSLETEAGGRVAGELLEGTVVDARTGDVVAESLTGSWDFTVEVTSPHRSYPTYEEEYRSGP